SSPPTRRPARASPPPSGQADGASSPSSSAMALGADPRLFSEVRAWRVHAAAAAGLQRELVRPIRNGGAPEAVAGAAEIDLAQIELRPAASPSRAPCSCPSCDKVLLRAGGDPPRVRRPQRAANPPRPRPRRGRSARRVSRRSSATSALPLLLAAASRAGSNGKCAGPLPRRPEPGAARRWATRREAGKADGEEVEEEQGRV
ncbi:unnamed protein product, partial [Urochloa humidicola]